MLDKTLFVSDTIHEREVELADGSKHTMYFRELPASEFQRYSFNLYSEDEQKRLDATPQLIAASLCTEDGKPAITIEQAKKLKAGPSMAIFRAVQDVNNPQEKKR